CSSASATTSGRRSAGSRDPTGRPRHEPGEGLLAGRGLYEARRHPLLRGDLPEAPAVREGPAARPSSLPERASRGVLLPEGEAREYAVGHADRPDRPHERRADI